MIAFSQSSKASSFDDNLKVLLFGSRIKTNHLGLIIWVYSRLRQEKEGGENRLVLNFSTAKILPIFFPKRWPPNVLGLGLRLGLGTWSI